MYDMGFSLTLPEDLTIVTEYSAVMSQNSVLCNKGDFVQSSTSEVIQNLSYVHVIICFTDITWCSLGIYET